MRRLLKAGWNILDNEISTFTSETLKRSNVLDYKYSGFLQRAHTCVRRNLQPHLLASHKTLSPHKHRPENHHPNPPWRRLLNHALWQTRSINHYSTRYLYLTNSSRSKMFTYAMLNVQVLKVSVSNRNCNYLNFQTQ